MAVPTTAEIAERFYRSLPTDRGGTDINVLCYKGERLGDGRGIPTATVTRGSVPLRFCPRHSGRL